MKITCAKHGEVEALVDQNYDAWCPKCRDEAIAAALSTPEGKRKLSEALWDVIHRNRKPLPPVDLFPVQGKPRRP